MFFLEPTETPYDLRWRMFGIDVRVHPMFWGISVFMGWSTIWMGFQYLAIWVACVFVSILIHELGHVCMGQILGSRGHIVLYGFGGLAIGSNQLERRWQRIAVSFAGPLAGFLFLGAILLTLWRWDEEAFPYYLFLTKASLGLPLEWGNDVGFIPRLPHPAMLFTIHNLIFINLMWGLVNLLPVWPLDGGQISRETLEGITPARGLYLSLGISLTVASLLSLHCFLVIGGSRLLPLDFGSFYTAILFGVLALQSYQMLQRIQARRQWMEERWDDRE